MSDSTQWMIEILVKWVPVLSPLSVAVNVLLMWRRSRRLVEEDPDLEGGFRKLFCGYLVLWGIPLLIMSLGILTGSVPDLWYFGDLASGHPLVLAFWVVLAVLVIAVFAWVGFAGGAEFLIKYYWPVQSERERRQNLVRTPGGLRVFSIIGLLFALLVVTLRIFCV